MKERYIELMEAVLEAYNDEQIRAYTESVEREGLQEHGYPRLTANLGILIAHGRKTAYKDTFRAMMDLCCREIPTARNRNGRRVGNDFSVKEIVFCLLEVEQAGLFDKTVTDGWRAALAAIDPMETYSEIAPTPVAPVANWAAFAAASEQMRKYAGIGDESAFIENQVASQLFSFDENGMYRDPNEPMVYDFVTRLQLAVALHFGYDGPSRAALEEQLMKPLELTLQMQSVTGEIPYGGRSNQFLHNETFYAALCEFYATRLKAQGDLTRAGAFKRAARLATESILPWLAEKPIHHVKSYYPSDSLIGCEGYAYFDKYMVTTGSWLYLAYAMADDDIAECPCPAEEGNRLFGTSAHFHKLFCRFGDYFVEWDTKADPHYDASGLGRVQRAGLPGTLCMAVPFAEHPNYGLEQPNPGPLAIGGGLCTEQGTLWSCAPDATYTVRETALDASCARVKLVARLANGAELTETYTVDESGVTLTVERADPGRVAVRFPLFAYDGKNRSAITLNETEATVTYKGGVCRYATDGDLRCENAGYGNRNGVSRGAVAYGTDRVTLKISLERA